MIQQITVCYLSVLAIGFATFQLEGANMVRMVKYVLNLDHCHVNTAQILRQRNGSRTGNSRTSVPHKDILIFITTQAWADRFSRESSTLSVDAKYS